MKKLSVSKSERNKKYYQEHRNGLRVKRAVRYQKERLDRPKSLMLYSAKIRAGKKNLPFTVTAEDFTIPEYCPVFKNLKLEPGNGQKKPSSPSLDRIDNTKGYIPGNVWVISSKANTMKNDATLDDCIEFSNFDWVSLREGSMFR